LAFFICEGRLVCAFIVDLFSAHRICDHQNLESVERLLGKRFSVYYDAITIIEEQFRKWLVAAGSCVKVMMCFIKQHTRRIFLVGGIGNSGIELGIGDLLPNGNTREKNDDRYYEPQITQITQKKPY